jgi:hypothetical protein
MARLDRTNPELGVSDTKRNAVASELGQHFQDRRLDLAERDERVAAARTWVEGGRLRQWR